MLNNDSDSVTFQLHKSADCNWAKHHLDCFVASSAIKIKHCV